jgi:NmrA-like family
MLAPIPQNGRQRINAQHINVDKLESYVASERKWVMSQKLAVVVTGGTGKQGGAVVKSLLARGHEVRAVTRSTDSAKARELANAGVALVRASLEDTAALTKALE